MMKSNTGIIYQRRKRVKKITQPIPVFGGRKKLGFLFLGLSLVGFLYFSSPFVAAQIAQQKKQGFDYLIEKEPVKAQTEEVKPEVQPETPEVAPQPLEIKSFYLTIEKIGLHSAPVIANIDVNNKGLYDQALQYGLVHAQGTALPGQGQMVYIFGHSTSQPWYVKELNALLYQIEKVEVNDKIKIEFNGEHYLYYVYDKQIVDPQSLRAVKNEVDQDVLIIQSCWPPGTALKRLLLFARPSKMGALIY